MRLFVGLGNPGAQYSRNRHNIGFMVADALAHAHDFSPWRNDFSGEFAEGRIDKQNVFLLKPKTFMNNSGQSVRAVADFYKIAPGDVVVFHDELDLPAFKVRIKTGGGSAGHNGLKSLDSHLGAGYQRVRLGIGRPVGKATVSRHVLGNFAKAEGESLQVLLDALCGAAGYMAQGDMARVQNDVAQLLVKETGSKKPIRKLVKEFVEKARKKYDGEPERSFPSVENLARKFMG